MNSIKDMLEILSTLIMPVLLLSRPVVYNMDACDIHTVFIWFLSSPADKVWGVEREYRAQSTWRLCLSRELKRKGSLWKTWTGLITTSAWMNIMHLFFINGLWVHPLDMSSQKKNSLRWGIYLENNMIDTLGIILCILKPAAFSTVLKK